VFAKVCLTGKINLPTRRVSIFALLLDKANFFALNATFKDTWPHAKNKNKFVGERQIARKFNSEKHKLQFYKRGKLN